MLQRSNSATRPDLHALVALAAACTMATWLPTAVFAQGPSGASSFRMLAPVDCNIGTRCFVQQFPDMDGAENSAIDPLCGQATYDGHDGVDIRVTTLEDMAKGVDVVAVAPGRVLRIRDGEPDRLVQSKVDRQSVAGKECGNGIVIAHRDGYETQYCHLRQGSVVVSPGEEVVAGQKLGSVGASGLVQFPHVHLTVRAQGKKVDPTTGHEVGSGCSTAADPASSL